ncbi:ferritin [Corynebacterium gerontici]|uniref:Ferritin n=1 Tax=Corynebacterium gerontici TaxID=2079234 RepID=A0A3G6J1S9_9CORY|nr:ferritin [Corynebacterium gerontici]AZA12005.1 Ferritin [Corynebacterium gerontici]
MTIHKKLAEALDKQVTAELEAALIYLQLSYQLEELGLSGMAHWMKMQHAEELEHAQLFADHLLQRDYTPQIAKIEAPKVRVNAPIDAFEASLAHEKKVSGLIRDLAAISDSVKDFDSRPMLDRFLEEQIEEEASVKGIIDRLKLADTGTGLLSIDAELGQR